jgi:hypothetical protein
MFKIFLSVCCTVTIMCTEFFITRYYNQHFVTATHFLYLRQRDKHVTQMKSNDTTRHDTARHGTARHSNKQFGRTVIAIIRALRNGCQAARLVFSVATGAGTQLFEYRVLMRIFGPNRDEVTGVWSKLHNEQFNPLPPNNIHICRTAPLTSRRCILNIYSTNIRAEYFKHAA